MKDNLKSQPTAAPTRKMAAVGISGALTTFIITVVNIYFPGVGELLSPAIEATVVAAVVSVANFASGYMTKNRDAE
jgi:hypothetical protein